MGQAGTHSYAHYRKLEERDALPDDGGFPSAEEFFAEAFARHVGDSAMDARYFTAGWLREGREGRDLRDTVAHLDVLSRPAARLAGEALARVWGVADGPHEFSYVLCNLALGVPASHLQPALEGVAQALAGIADVRRYRAILAEFQPQIVLRTPQGQAAWTKVADTLRLDRKPTPVDAPLAHAGKRKRDKPREGLQDGEARTSSSSSSSDPSSESPSDSPADSPTLRRSPGPRATDSELQAFILSVMQPAQPSPASPPHASAQHDDCPATPSRSPARKKGFVIPRDRSPKA